MTISRALHQVAIVSILLRKDPDCRGLASGGSLGERAARSNSPFFTPSGRPLSGMNLMAGKAVPEVEWQALVQQDPHAILASSESFASSGT